MVFDYDGYVAKLDIEAGDIIDVASDLICFAMYCRKKKIVFDPNGLIDALQKKVTDQGTVMIRTFNWDFNHGIDFDINKTKSGVGALGNVAMERPDFRRTKHPIYSWWVWGKDAEALISLNNSSSFGVGTPFDYLYHHNGKQVTLGNAPAACTQIHHCEAIAKVPYRYDKSYTAGYIDENGERSERTYSMHVRPWNLSVNTADLIEEPYFAEFFKKNKVLTEDIFMDYFSAKTYKIKELTDLVVENLTEGDGSLVVMVDGKPGYKHDSIEWDKLTF